MQTTIAQKIQEVKIDQALAALQEISTQKEQVDKQISALLSENSELASWSLMKLSTLATLKSRRETLIKFAEVIMRLP